MEGIILSSWDYIMGPQIERLWLINYCPKLTQSEVSVEILRDFNISKHYSSSNTKNELISRSDLKIYSFMSGQLLLGEMDTLETNERNTSRTYITDMKILTSVVFRMKSWIYVGTVKEVENVSLCIGLIYKRDAFDFIFKNQFILDVHLRKLADFLQRTKLPQDLLSNEFSESVLHVTTLLDSLYNNADHFQNHISSIDDYSVSGVLTEAIVSHLQTSGHTAVLGGSEYKLKQIINILSLFCNEEKFSSSLAINQRHLNSSVSSFHIRGIIKNSEKDCENLLEQAYDESLSLTVIDTDLCRVWQTYPFHVCTEKNRAYSIVSETGSFVPQLLDNLFFADKNFVDCQKLIRNFTKLLVTRAVALVKTVNHFRNDKRVLSKQELMTLLAVQSAEDLQILLGYAEKIKPGIRLLVL